MLTINKSQIIAWAGWVILIAVLLFEFKCGGRHDSATGITASTGQTKTETKTVYILDTVVRNIPVTQLIPSDTVFVPVPSRVDTAAILKDYFAKYFYTDSIADTLMKAWVNDTVTQNRITSRTFKYKLLRPQTIQYITNTTVSAFRKFELYAGGSLSFNKRVITDVGPELLLTTPRQMAFGAGYGLLTQSISAKIYLKIK